ncbi:acetyltransferase [Vibrio cholerae]|nr:acetyltransferase [Vibrio cholerae]
MVMVVVFEFSGSALPALRRALAIRGEYVGIQINRRNH